MNKLNNKHIKLNVQKHEVKDFPVDKLQFSEKWIKLLEDDTHGNNNRYTFRY